MRGDVVMASAVAAMVLAMEVEIAMSVRCIVRAKLVFRDVSTTINFCVNFLTYGEFINYCVFSKDFKYSGL